jgi:uncharacterized membrane protein YjgN (DUF898 family)
MNEMVKTSVPSVPSNAPASGVTFDGKRSDFRRLVMRGALLELVTVGFYRFWLATDMRRHLWSHTSVGGDAPEYTGTAKELLIGFLFALAILVPIYLVYFFIGIEAERWQEFASFPLIAFFYLFTQFAMYRARRYRLTRTVWRGVRFWMAGSGWSYAWRAALWGVFVTVTLGLALPWRTAALERYKMKHTSYGNLQGRFDATGGEFFKQAWHLWLLTWPAAIFIVPLPFIYGAYKSIEWRWWVSGIRFGEVRFESKLSDGALIGLYWKVIGWSTLFLVLLSGWIGGVIGAGVAANGGGTSEQQMALVLQQPTILIAMAAGYVVIALAFGMILRIYLMRDVWARVANATLVYNLAAAENVTGQGDAVSALGEGFADSLDIGGF